MSEQSDREWLLKEASKVARALGESLSPFCEVILSDLTDPEHVIIQIENSLSGRSVGDAASELGLARISDPTFPDVIANYANTFPDGRQVKSTSIGLRDKSGRFIAALCINFDITYLKSITAYLNEITKVSNPPETLQEVLYPRSVSDVSAKIIEFAAARNRDARALTTDEKRDLLQKLAAEGELERRGAVETIAGLLGVTRTQVYYYLRKKTGRDDDAVARSG